MANPEIDNYITEPRRKTRGKRILIMGLNDSGKSTFAQLLRKKLQCPYFNADTVRSQFRDTDFTIKGRNRQARRMKILCDFSLLLSHDYAIADFICPTTETRQLFSPHHLVFLDTVDRTPFLDTQRMFIIPTLYTNRDMRILFKKDFEDEVNRFIWNFLKKSERR